MFTLLMNNVSRSLHQTSSIRIRFRTRLRGRRLKINLRAISFRSIHIIHMVRPRPRIKIRTNKRLTRRRHIFKSSRSQSSTLTLRTVTISLNVLKVLSLLIQSVLIVHIPNIPSSRGNREYLLSSLLQAFPPRHVRHHLRHNPIHRLNHSQGSTLPSNGRLNVKKIRVIRSPFSSPIGVFLLINSSFHTTFQYNGLNRHLSSTNKDPSNISSVLIFLIRGRARRHHLSFQIRLTRRRVTFQLHRAPMLLMIPQIGLRVSRGVKQLGVTFNRLMLIHTIVTLNSISKL